MNFFGENCENPTLWAWHFFDIPYLSRSLADFGYRSLGTLGSCEKRRWKGVDIFFRSRVTGATPNIQRQ